MLTTLVLWPLEQLLNQLLASDPYLGKQLQRFSGKAIAIKGRAPGFDLVIQFAPGRIQLAGQSPGQLGVHVDAALEGDSADLASLLLSPESERPLANPALVFSGNARLIQELYQTLSSLDLRWDDYLAPVLGDVLTRQGSIAQKNVTDWLRHSRQRARENLEDYLKEESRLLPHQEDVARFRDELDALRLQLDRAEARVELLKSRADQLSD